MLITSISGYIFSFFLILFQQLFFFFNSLSCKILILLHYKVFLIHSRGNKGKQKNLKTIFNIEVDKVLVQIRFCFLFFL